MMKKLFLPLIFLLIFNTGFSQINLVSNPSFEDTVFCPQMLGDIHGALHWMNFGNSPDYFNACHSTGLNIPNCIVGYQEAHSGNAVAGLITWCNATVPNGLNYREFIGTQLVTPLQTGIQYFISFYAVNANSVNYCLASNNLGLNFSTVHYDSSNIPTLNNYAHLFESNLITDTLNWVKISGTFTADSNYTYLTIGNFFDDNNTDTLNNGPYIFSAYYYIDDICVSTDSNYCNTWTGIHFQDEVSEVQLYPNPTNSTIHIFGPINFEQIQILNAVGQEILKKNLHGVNQIDVSRLAEGFYTVLLRRGKDSISRKIIIQR